MDQDVRRKQSFLLRLPLSVREEAARLAHSDGISLNHFISLAVSAKVDEIHRSCLHKEAAASELRVPHRPTRTFGSFQS